MASKTRQTNLDRYLFNYSNSVVYGTHLYTRLNEPQPTVREQRHHVEQCY